jgi:hypothetical protein
MSVTHSGLLPPATPVGAQMKDPRLRHRAQDYPGVSNTWIDQYFPLALRSAPLSAPTTSRSGRGSSLFPRLSTVRRTGSDAVGKSDRDPSLLSTK